MDTYDFPFSYRTVTLNEHRTSDGSLIPGAAEADTIRVTSFDYSRLQQRDQREALHLLSGGDLGDATHAFRYISLAGMIRGSSGAKLDDRVSAFLQAFDVEEAQRDSPATEGVAAFGFTGVTTISNGRGTPYTDEHGAAGGFYVPERFMARPAALPIVTGRRSAGDSAVFSAELVCADPRRYCNVAESIVLNSANSYTLPCPNWNANVGKAVSPFLTIVMAGAGHAAFSIAFGALTLVLDLSGLINGNVVTIDAATGVIKVGSTRRADLQTSAAQTVFLLIPRGGVTPVVANPTNVTSITIAYRQARS